MSEAPPSTSTPSFRTPICEVGGGGWFFPLFDFEYDLPKGLRALLYVIIMLYCFVGVAIVSDVFMSAIETITSQTKRITVLVDGDGEPIAQVPKKKLKKVHLELPPSAYRRVTVAVWNETVSNLSLMALGSSAPEILLSLLELIRDDFFAGDVGPSTIVGSAAFNLFVITGVCIMAFPEGEVRFIKEMNVFFVTATFSIFAYLWMVFVLMVNTPDIVDLSEGIITLCFFPLLIGTAYVADRGWFSSKEDQIEAMRIVTVPAQIVDAEEMAELAAQVHSFTVLVRQRHGHDLSEDQVLRIIEAERPPHMSRAQYRIQAVRSVFGGRRISFGEAVEARNRAASLDGTVGVFPSISAKEGNSSIVLPRQAVATVQFCGCRFAVMEGGKANLPLMRTGDKTQEITVYYQTRDGTAVAGKSYEETSGNVRNGENWKEQSLFAFGPQSEEHASTSYLQRWYLFQVTFKSQETKATIQIPIIDDDTEEPDENFYVRITQVSEGHKIGKNAEAEVTIIDTDGVGILQFKTDEVVVEGTLCDPFVTLSVERRMGSKGEVSCSYRTENGSAMTPWDYEEAQGELRFASGQCQASIQITLSEFGRLHRESFFSVILSEPKGGATFSKDTDGGEEKCICCVRLKPEAGALKMGQRLKDALQYGMRKTHLGTQAWVEQISSSILVGGSWDDQSEAGLSQWLLHFIALPWKLLFMLIPPPEFANGWVCFYMSLGFIGLVTAVVSDLASLIGCVLEMHDMATAITLVALGTSLPDTFASMTAAKQDPYADASVGNVTGSNSVNVFLGLGISWTIGSVYWGMQGATDQWKAGVGEAASARFPQGGFYVPAKELGFSVAVYVILALIAIAGLLVRRNKYGGELGGPRKAQLVSGFMFIGLWLTYIGISLVKVLT